ncbi:MAG TPA: signal peptidase I [Bdellovibrionales bacterium]|nr:signal peptidase I [Bdellovibrionales bacterium]
MKSNAWRSYALAVGIALTLRWGAVEAYVVPSGSMIPTLMVNDHIFVNKAAYGVRVPFSRKWLMRYGTPARGEVIVFRSPEPEGLTLVKRVVGVAGDRVEYDGRILTLNGAAVPAVPSGGESLSRVPSGALEEAKGDHVELVEALPGRTHAVIQRSFAASMALEAFTVPPGHVFVMGDHRDNSRDSRAWGVVPVENLYGRAELVWLACERKIPVAEVFCDPLKMSWDRLGEPVR